MLSGHVEDTSQNQDQLRRKSEIFFSRAHWKLTETDGQLGIADAIITKFYYCKSVMRDDAVEHLTEIGYLVLLHHMFSRILNFLFVILFSRKNKRLPIFVPNFCRNDELSSTMSCVGCLLTDLVLPDT